jgi:O-antigen ligase
MPPRFLLEDFSRRMTLLDPATNGSRSRRLRTGARRTSRSSFSPNRIGVGVPFHIAESAPTVLFAVFLIALAGLGGASRADALSQPFVRLAAVLLGAGALLLPRTGALRLFRWPLALLSVFALLIACQLIPLPPSIWTALPGRSVFTAIASLAEVAQPWRPISLDPDLTLNSVMALTVPAAALLLFADLHRDRWFAALCMILLLIGVSAIFGLGQVSGRLDGLYLYRVTNPDSAVGLFANRNHQAVLLAIALPMLGTFAAFPLRTDRAFDPRVPVAIVASLFLAPLVLVTGSRSGLMLMVVGAVMAWLIYKSGPDKSMGGPDPRLKHRRSARSNRVRWAVILGVGMIILLMAATVILNKAEALKRIVSLDLDQEQRAQLFGTLVQLIGKYFPVGAGFGTFDPVFRIDEPFFNLSPKYLNHAHNDWIEFAIEGGLPALLLLCAFVVWFVRRAARYWIGPQRGRGRAELLGRLGSTIIIMLGFASLWDYPLRTPLMAAMLAISCCFISLEPRAGAGEQRAARSVADED